VVGAHPGAVETELLRAGEQVERRSSGGDVSGESLEPLALPVARQRVYADPGELLAVKAGKAVDLVQQDG
jgi:hypothetical protein